MAETPMRRNDKQIAERTEIDRIIDEALVMHLGLIDGDRPYVVPLNFGREGDDIWFHSAAGGHKLDCVRACPRVCVQFSTNVELMIGGADPCSGWTSRYESVTGWGVAEIVEDPAEKRAGLDVIMRKYSGRGGWQFKDGELRSTAVARIRLESMTGKRSPVVKP